MAFPTEYAVSTGFSKGSVFVSRMRKIALLVAIAMAFSVCALALGPDSDRIYAGIDVSAFQGKIDFEKVRQAGIEVVYIRAGLGDDYVDPYYRRNAEGAQEQGLRFGFYYYVTAENADEARAQAERFYDLIQEYEYNCRPALDFEEYSGKSAARINEIGLAFLQRIQQLTGVTPALYTDAYAADRVWDAALGAYPLWVADYGAEEPDVTSGHWEGWSGFQYTDRGSVDGISGNVDRDRFTDTIFVDETPPVEDGYVYHVVRTGETLSEIAARFDVRVERLARLNNIQNVNLIYVGQLLRIPVDDNFIAYVIRRGDTLYALARRYGTTVETLAELNRISDISRIIAGDTLFIPKR